MQLCHFRPCPRKISPLRTDVPHYFYQSVEWGPSICQAEFFFGRGAFLTTINDKYVKIQLLNNNKFRQSRVGNRTRVSTVIGTHADRCTTKSIQISEIKAEHGVPEMFQCVQWQRLPFYRDFEHGSTYSSTHSFHIE